MLKKRFRLNTSAFKEVFNFGQTSRSPLFLVKKRDNDLKFSRFAVVVSKKISKKAFERNYLKRKFMHALGEKGATFPKADYIFVLNSSAKDVEYKDLLTSLDTIK
jgi:ribonuclease P protein component